LFTAKAVLSHGELELDGIEFPDLYREEKGRPLG
jgi:hypothetical protein